jgi:CheY-like chemotaxis protein
LMQVVVGHAEFELRTRQDLDAQSRKRQTRILESAQFASQLTSSFLRFASTETTGKVNEAIKAVLLCYRSRVPHDIKITWEEKPDLCAVALGTGYLQLVLANIVKNALEAMSEHMQPGELSINTSSDQNVVRITIWNSGTKIPDHVASKLFNEHITTKSGSGGTGVGLSASLAILKQVGGSLRFENIAGGVAFYIEIPKAAIAVNSAPSAPNDLEFEPEQPSEKRIKGRRILIVDDDPAVQDILRLIVVQLGGGEAELCPSAATSLAVMKDKDFDVVLLDMRLKGESGADVFAAMPESFKRKTVFITGDALNGELKTFVTGVARPLLIKPLRPGDLFSAIERVLADAC